jgi:hypothetical protein
VIRGASLLAEGRLVVTLFRGIALDRLTFHHQRSDIRVLGITRGTDERQVCHEAVIK